MAINTNHTLNKIVATENDLVLDAYDNINVSTKRVVDLQDPVDLQDAVTKKFLTDKLAELETGSSTSLADLEALIDTKLANIGDVLIKLAPQKPDFISLKSLEVLNAQSYRITDFTQTDNTSNGLTANAGDIVTNVLRSDDFATNLLEEVGPGDSGIVQIKRNGLVTSEVTLDTTENNGTFTDTDSLIISNNVDYGTITGNPLGFDFVYNVQSTGTNTVPEGWNNVQIRHELTEDSEVLTNEVTWYSDQSNPGAPTITNKVITPSTTTTGVVHSSTVPHYTSAQQFDISFSVGVLSGDFYPSTDTFITATGSNPSAVNNINNLAYTDVGIATPLPRNYLATGTHTVLTSTNVKSGTGISVANEGPSIMITNSYQNTTTKLAIAEQVIYMLDDATFLNVDETNIEVVNVGYGSGNATRYETVGTDTPNQATANSFDGQNSVLNNWDATVVGGDVKHDETDYSTGYLPVGPNLSENRSSSQYIVFGFNRTAVSKFAVEWSGKISGCWVSMPGTAIDATSTLNGWLDATAPYEGIGIPGANTSTNGNGSNGCGLAGVASTGIIVNSETFNVTFGTESSSNATDNLIVVRFKLLQGDYINALQFKTAT